MKQEFNRLLELHNYKSVWRNDTVTVYLDKKLTVKLKLDGDKLSIVEEQILGWNPLSGFFNFTLRTSLITNTVMLGVVLLLLELIKFSRYEYDYSNFLLVGIAVNILWFFYFQIKFESFKTQLTTWLK